MSSKYFSKTVFILMSYMEWATEMGEKDKCSDTHVWGFQHLVEKDKKI